MNIPEINDKVYLTSPVKPFFKLSTSATKEGKGTLTEGQFEDSKKTNVVSGKIDTDPKVKSGRQQPISNFGWGNQVKSF